MISSFVFKDISLEERGSLGGAHLKQLDVRLVVVGHPNFEPAVSVEIRGLKRTDSTTGFHEDVVRVIEDRSVAAGV